jgi:hypothetical protein
MLQVLFTRWHLDFVVLTSAEDLASVLISHCSAHHGHGPPYLRYLAMDSYDGSYSRQFFLISSSLLDEKNLPRGMALK